MTIAQFATDACLKLQQSSEISANPEDNGDHPKGVWSLSPTLALGDKDKVKYQAIGESDRMIARFVKPDKRQERTVRDAFSRRRDPEHSCTGLAPRRACLILHAYRPEQTLRQFTDAAGRPTRANDVAQKAFTRRGAWTVTAKVKVCCCLPATAIWRDA